MGRRAGTETRKVEKDRLFERLTALEAHPPRTAPAAIPVREAAGSAAAAGTRGTAGTSSSRLKPSLVPRTPGPGRPSPTPRGQTAARTASRLSSLQPRNRPCSIVRARGPGALGPRAVCVYVWVGEGVGSCWTGWDYFMGAYDVAWRLKEFTGKASVMRNVRVSSL